MGEIIKIKKIALTQNDKAIQTNDELAPLPDQSPSIPNPADSNGSGENSDLTIGSNYEDSLKILKLIIDTTSESIEFLCGR